MITVDELDDYLDKLTEYGVTSFSCEAFSVRIGPQPVEADDDDVSVNEAIRQAAVAENAPRAAKGLYGHPSLWPNGAPPHFPGSERATRDHTPTHPDED